MQEACDVFILGGGPAGSTAAALLAERGWKVVITDKERHPRFHIGESMLPMSTPLRIDFRTSRNPYAKKKR